MNLWPIFLTGLFTGGLTCMAVQGGLLTATLAQREEERIKSESRNSGNAIPILSFLIAKIIAYSVLGLFLGLSGSIIQLSITARIILQVSVIIFMIGTAFNLLEVHPIFRYFIIQPPKFLYRLIRNRSKSNDLFAPTLIGLLTVFIPCGTTQAMMALALASANPLTASLIMFAFTLGTSPLFFTLGFLATRLSVKLNHSFMRIAAFSIIVIAVFNLNSAVALTGSNFTLQNIWQDVACTVLSECSNTVLALNPHQAVDEATINFSTYGYSPESITVKTGSKVKLNLVNARAGGCIQAFIIPNLNIQKIVRRGTSEEVEFIAPDTPQDLKFMCSMGMYQGTIHVI